MDDLQIKWHYSDVGANELPPDPAHFAVHFVFSVCRPPISGSFSFNAISPSMAQEWQLSMLPTRSCLVTEAFDYLLITKTVQQTVASAFAGKSYEQALETLNSLYIRSGLDFTREFESDACDEEVLIAMIRDAFDRTERGKGITLHEAAALDDWADVQEQKQARKLDREDRWQDVSDDDIASQPSFLSFLDAAGYRYYLPANMTWSLRHWRDDRWDCAYSTYLSLLPVIAPRDKGRGLGEKFDVQAFIRQYAFSARQVKAIYHFLCFMAVKANFGVAEDHYPAMMKWQAAAVQ